MVYRAPMPDETPPPTFTLPRVTSGAWMMATGVLHTLVLVVLATSPLRDLLAAGWVGAVEPDPMRMAVFWSLCFGLVLVLYGIALRETEHLDRRLPSPVHGWLMIGLSVLGGAAIPASGFWLALPQGVWILRRHAASRR